VRGFGHGAMHEISGSYIPLHEISKERRATSDPRSSILKRYPDADPMSARSPRLVEEGLMLEGMSSAPWLPPIGVARTTTWGLG
jgi:hypothetical protein